jgi:hypothetical protein
LCWHAGTSGRAAAAVADEGADEDQDLDEEEEEEEEEEDGDLPTVAQDWAGLQALPVSCLLLQQRLVLCLLLL